MTKPLLILSFIFFSFGHCVYSQIINRDTELRRIINEEGQAEVTIPLPDKSETDLIGRNVSISSLKDKTLHIILSEPEVEWFIQQNFNYRIIEKIYGKGIITSENLKQALEWESYPTLPQYDSIIQSFLSLYPSVCRVDTIGTSIKGKLILALKISDNASIDEDEPEVFFTSTMHGDETGGFILMLRLADYLLSNYSSVDRVKQLVDNLEIWLNPLANPDGTYRPGNTISSPVRGNANGYDLNRNFPDPVTSTMPQQKETTDMIRFMRKHNFVLSANFHSGSEVVNYPWDRWPRLHADNSWFYDISRKYADTVHFYSLPGYMTDLNDGVTNGYQWYSVNGGRQDFVTYELHGREVTIELDTNYVTPATHLASLWQYNRRSLIGYLENALYGIHGSVSDINTAEPVPAKVFITGHDKDNSQVYSDTLTGSFIRLLAPGSWDLLFSANGYKDTLITNVFVTEGQKAYLDVEMEPVTKDTIAKHDIPLLYPNPASLSLKILLPENISGKVNIVIFNQSGAKISDYNTETIKGIPVIKDVSNLAGGIYNMVITNTLTKISYKARFIVIRR